MSVVQRTASAVLAVALVSGLSSCAAGFTSATDKVQADNASGEAGSLLARAVVVVKSPKAIPAAIAGTLLNQGTQSDTLERIELTEATPGARTITLTPDLVIKPGEVIAFGAKGSEPITVPDATDLRVGNFAEVVLRFRTAGEIHLQVPIVVRSGFYSDILPSAPPPVAPDVAVATKKPGKSTAPDATPTATEPADDNGVGPTSPSPSATP